MLQVAKVELEKLARTREFELRYWNIRDPPSEASEYDAKKWRRLYQYDIVSIRSNIPKTLFVLRCSLVGTKASIRFSSVLAIADAY